MGQYTATTTLLAEGVITRSGTDSILDEFLAIAAAHNNHEASDFSGLTDIIPINAVVHNQAHFTFSVCCPFQLFGELTAEVEGTVVVPFDCQLLGARIGARVENASGGAKISAFLYDSDGEIPLMAETNISTDDHSSTVAALLMSELSAGSSIVMRVTIPSGKDIVEPRITFLAKSRHIPEGS